MTPHVVVMVGNEAHVIPVCALEGIVAGRYPSSNLGENVVRAIIDEWLMWLRERDR